MKKLIGSRVLESGYIERKYKVLEINLDTLLEYETVEDVMLQLTEWSDEYGDKLTFDYEPDEYRDQWFLFVKEVETEKEYRHRKEMERQKEEKAALEKQRRMEEQEQKRIRNEELNREKRYQQFLELQKEFGQ